MDSQVDRRGRAHGKDGRVTERRKGEWMDGLMDGYSADRRLGRQWTLGRATDGRVTSRRRDGLIDGHKTEGLLDKVQMDSQVLERADEGK